MYQILIVDDEPLAIQGIESGVQWAKLGVTAVFKASNIRQAREVYLNQRVDIMLCDIEMPQGNGLDLLSWVREHYPATESIILTCHADFEYARKALKLGSLDYVLKAMTYDELENVILKAIRKIEKDKKLIEYSQFGELWFKNQPYLLEQFWRDILNGKIASNDESIRIAAAERNIAFSPDIKLRPVLANIPYPNSRIQSAPDKEYNADFEKAYHRTFQDEIKGSIIQRDMENILCILQPARKAGQSQNDFMERYRKFAQTYKDISGRSLYIYVGGETTASGLADIVAKLFDLEKNNVALRNDILFLDAYPKQSSEFNIPDMGLWSSMISEKEYGLLIKDVTRYFERLVVEGSLNSQNLQQFHQDFLQMVYSSLKQKKIQAHLLLNDAESINLFDRATKSVTDMLVWIKHVVARIQEDALTNEGSLTIVEKVKRYIAIHINDNPGREDLANYVYLNPDYLSRLFKKETGMTLINYCQNMRLQYIKDLLTKTDMNIGKIAMQMGYSNFSHFTRAFKELTGISPTEYREKNKGK